MTHTPIQRGKYRLQFNPKFRTYEVCLLEPDTEHANLHFSITFHDGKDQFRATSAIPEKQSREEVLAEISDKLGGEFTESHCHYLLNGDIKIDLRNPDGEITKLQGYFKNCPTIKSFLYSSTNREAALRYFNGI